jgi:NAD(P)H-dependent flavin oxidoreductase YrpB (nitropropane dioxygenase family)
LPKQNAISTCTCQQWEKCIIIQEKASLFVSAVGVPPKAVVDKLHGAGILCMNMIGHPKHVQKALDVGVDIICAQGGERKG